MPSKSRTQKTACDKFELISAKLLQLIQDGKLPWRKPWNSTPCANAITGHLYSGWNPLLAQIDVQASGYSTPLFAGFNQAKEKGWTIRKGSKATWLRWGGLICREEQDAAGEISQTFFRHLKWLQVFNLDCFDDADSGYKVADLIHKYKPNNNAEPRLEEAERLIAAQQAVIKFGGSRACYVPATDRIQMPEFKEFSSAAAFYATEIHELIHRTGHPTRLNRSIQNKFGTSAYAFEELVAELGAAFVCSELDMTLNLEHHASYLQDWLSIIQSDNQAFFKASALAQKAANLLLENAGINAVEQAEQQVA